MTAIETMKVNVMRIPLQVANLYLNWWPHYSIEASVQITTEWYLLVKEKRQNAFFVTKEQIEKYMEENGWY